MNVFISWRCRSMSVRNTHIMCKRSYDFSSYHWHFYMNTDYYVCLMTYYYTVVEFIEEIKKCPFSIKYSFIRWLVVSFHFRVFLSFAGTMFVHWYLYGWWRWWFVWMWMHRERESEWVKDKCRERSMFTVFLLFLIYHIFHNKHTHAYMHTHIQNTHSLSSLQRALTLHSFSISVSLLLLRSSIQWWSLAMNCLRDSLYSENSHVVVCGAIRGSCVLNACQFTNFYQKS